MHDDQPALSLVSNGAQCIVIHKRLYVDHAPLSLLFNLTLQVSSPHIAVYIQPRRLLCAPCAPLPLCTPCIPNYENNSHGRTIAVISTVFNSLFFGTVRVLDYPHVIETCWSYGPRVFIPCKTSRRRPCQGQHWGEVSCLRLPCLIGLLCGRISALAH